MTSFKRTQRKYVQKTYRPGSTTGARAGPRTVRPSACGIRNEQPTPEPETRRPAAPELESS